MLDLAFLMLNVTGMLVGYGHNFIEVMLPNGTIVIFRTPQAMQIATQVPLGQNVSVVVNGTQLMLRYRYKHRYMLNSTVTQIEEMIGNKTICISCKEMKEMHRYKYMYNETEVTHTMRHKEMHKEKYSVTAVEKVSERTTTTCEEMKHERHEGRGEEHHK